MFKKTTICFGLASAILLQSCALVFSGTKDKVKVRSGTPSNAEVYYNGEKVGEGNCTVKVYNPLQRPSLAAFHRIVAWQKHGE